MQYPPPQQGPGYPPQPQQPYGVQPPPMYPMQPQPPQGGGPNVGLIVGLVVGIFVILPISILFCAGVFGYMRASRAARYSSTYSPAYTSTYTTPTYTSTYGTTTTTTPTAVPSLSEHYPTSNGLIVAHYPADFAAKSLDHATIMLSKNNTDGTDEVVTVAGVENPISNDVNEFSRVLVQQMKKNIEVYGDKWVETGRRRTVCFGGYSGLQIEGTYTASGITKENVKICYFMRPNKGYEMKTIVPARHEARDLPTLQSIVDATEIN
jgi:hypothetical protein